METLITNVDWFAVIVGAVASFLLGWFWYSKKGFGVKWAEGVGLDINNPGPMGLAMTAQIGATFLLSWVIGVAMVMDLLPLAILMVLTLTGFIKANGLYAQKSKVAITIETIYILAMAVIMVFTHQII